MSRGRFTALLSLLCVAVAAASFAAVTAILDDDDPSAPTDTAGDDGTAADGGGGGGEASSTTTSAADRVDGDGVVETPSFVVIVSSGTDEATAEADARAVQEAGYESGYLRSDDFPSLSPGFWVAFVGPFADADAARGQVAPLADDGFGGAYVRCLGTEDECG